MRNNNLVLLLVILLSLLWFIVTWTYISLDIYDVSQLEDGAYKVLHFRERFIEMALIVWMFLFGLCIGICYSRWNTSDAWKAEKFGFYPKNGDDDNLQIIEGIGPKIEQVLKSGGITSFHWLELASTKDIWRILEKAGKQFALANPATWSKQAGMAEQERWRELKEYQDELLGGL